MKERDLRASRMDVRNAEDIIRYLVRPPRPKRLVRSRLEYRAALVYSWRIREQYQHSIFAMLRATRAVSLAMKRLIKSGDIIYTPMKPLRFSEAL
jgi:hypothetical protein